MPPRITTTRDSDAVIVLQTSPGGGSKQHRLKDGKILTEGYSKSLLFPWKALAANDFSGLSRMLSTLAGRDDVFVIRGGMGEDSEAKFKGKPVARRQLLNNPDDPLAVWQDIPRRWGLIDIEHLKLPSDIKCLPYTEKMSWLVNRMPEPFTGHSCIFQRSASAGLKDAEPDDELRVHLWYWFNEPVTCSQLKAHLTPFADSHAIDLSIYKAVQPLYICKPKFADMEDPIPNDERLGIALGDFGSEVDSTAILGVHTEGVEAMDRAEAILVTRTTSGIVPNEKEIAQRVAKILKANIKTSRHHYAIGACCELLAVGATLDLLEIVASEIVSRGTASKPPRDAAPREIDGIIAEAVKKFESGKMRIDAPADSTLLAEADKKAATADDSEAVGAEEVLGNPMVYRTLDAFDGARQYLRECHDGATLLRWAETDYEYTGKCWQKLEDDEVLPGRISRHTRLVPRKANEITKAIRAAVQVERLAPPMMIKSRKPLTDSIIFNNGVLNANAWLKDPNEELTPHSSDIFSFTCLPFDYDPEAKHPAFTAFIESIWPNDLEQRREFQKMLGYLLLPDNRFQKMFMFQGARRSGKGTILRLIEDLIGEANCCSPTISSLGERFGVAPLVGKSVALIGEMNDQQAGGSISTTAIDRLKSITGVDGLPIDRKGKSESHLRLKTRFVIACNRIPMLVDPSGAIQVRTILFSTPISFVGREDVELQAKLHAELPGIANFALAGLRLLLQEDNGFREPSTVTGLKELYRRATAPAESFIADCCVKTGFEERVLQRDLYAVYRAWCAEFGHKPMASARFTLELHQLLGGDINLTRPRTGPDGVSRLRGIDGLVLSAKGIELLKANGDPTESL